MQDLSTRKRNIFLKKFIKIEKKEENRLYSRGITTEFETVACQNLQNGKKEVPCSVGYDITGKIRFQSRETRNNPFTARILPKQKLVHTFSHFKHKNGNKNA